MHEGNDFRTWDSWVNIHVSVVFDSSCWQCNCESYSVNLSLKQFLGACKCTESLISRWHFLHQTAEIILRSNTHCPGMEMALEPLLRERVRSPFLIFPNIKVFHVTLQLILFLCSDFDLGYRVSVLLKGVIKRTLRTWRMLLVSLAVTTHHQEERL